MLEIWDLVPKKLRTARKGYLRCLEARRFLKDVAEGESEEADEILSLDISSDGFGLGGRSVDAGILWDVSFIVEGNFQKFYQKKKIQECPQKSFWRNFTDFAWTVQETALLKWYTLLDSSFMIFTFLDRHPFFFGNGTLGDRESFALQRSSNRCWECTFYVFTTNLCNTKHSPQNTTQIHFKTPLHYAAQHGFYDIAFLLLRAGAYVDALGKDNRSYSTSRGLSRWWFECPGFVDS